MNGRLLRNFVSLDRATNTVGPDGAVIPTWNQVHQFGANIKPVSAREFEFAKTFAATVNHRLTIRWMTDIQVNDRLVYNQRVFLINGILNCDERGQYEERNVWLTLYCTEQLLTDTDTAGAVLHYNLLSESDYLNMTEAQYLSMVET